MSDKTNVEEIIGFVKTDEVIDGVEEVRKLRGRESDSDKIEEVIFEGPFYYLEKGEWHLDDGKFDGVVQMVNVPVKDLLCAWEDLVSELSDKEVELANVREEHNRKEFEILTSFDFKKVYGKDNEKIRKAHVHNELFDLDKSISDLELSINWIRGYVPLLRECIKVKQQ